MEKLTERVAAAIDAAITGGALMEGGWVGERSGSILPIDGEIDLLMIAKAAIETMSTFELTENHAVVPLELLQKVLEQAELDNYSVEGELSHPDSHAQCETERAAIDELRRIAGIPL